MRSTVQQIAGLKKMAFVLLCVAVISFIGLYLAVAVNIELRKEKAEETRRRVQCEESMRQCREYSKTFLQ